jgi:hypothetical protein
LHKLLYILVLISCFSFFFFFLDGWSYHELTIQDLLGQGFSYLTSMQLVGIMEYTEALGNNHGSV